MKRALVLLVALLAPSAPPPAAAGARVTGATWQHARSLKEPRYFAVESIPAAPAERLRGKIRVLVDLYNKDKAHEAGIVLRYAVQAALAPVDPERAGEEPVWMPPFQVEERRVPRLRGLRARRYPIADLQLAGYLAKMRQSGFWPRALRITVMVQPKPGDKLADVLFTSEIPVSWEEADDRPQAP